MSGECARQAREPESLVKLKEMVGELLPHVDLPEALAPRMTRGQPSLLFLSPFETSTRCHLPSSRRTSPLRSE
jgi:hypothetical protein